MLVSAKGNGLNHSDATTLNKAVTISWKINSTDIKQGIWIIPVVNLLGYYYLPALEKTSGLWQMASSGIEGSTYQEMIEAESSF